MKELPLGSICDINPRRTAGLNSEIQCSFIPMEYVDDRFGIVTKKSTRQLKEVEKGYTAFQEEDILFAKITPCMENGKCAIAKNLVNGLGFGSTEFHVIRVEREIIPEWVYYFLRQESARKKAELNMTGSAGQKRVPSSFLEEILIPLPPLPEQKRIATILEKADRLRRQRRYALELCNYYLQSIFLEMFYEKADKDWPNVSIESLGKRKKDAIRTGPFGSQLLHSEFVDGGIAVLGIDNAVQNRFSWGVRRFITKEKYQPLKRYTVFPGDVIITIMGTPGRCAVIPDNFPLAINTKHLCCITLDQDQCLPDYLKFCFLTHPSVLNQLKVWEHGAVMPGLNMDIIKNLLLPRPPIPIQEKFIEIVHKFELLLDQQREAERQAEHLFQTLLHQAFEGNVGLGYGIGQDEFGEEDVHGSELTRSYVQLQMKY